MPPYKNVIFDLDGLIVDTEPLHQRALNALIRFAGVEHQFGTYEYGQDFTGRPIFENVEYVRERFGLPQTAEQLSEGHRVLFNILIADAENLEPMPGLTELLNWLLAEKYHVAVASSSRPEQVHLVIRNLNLLHHFETLVGNDGTLKPKPSPDVYLLALEKLGISASDTVALEDSNSGVRAARNAGLDVIAVPNAFTAEQDLSMANCVLPDLHQVRDYLEKSNNHH
jgi:beta-phosphoglucomutase